MHSGVSCILHYLSFCKAQHSAWSFGIRRLSKHLNYLRSITQRAIEGIL